MDKNTGYFSTVAKPSANIFLLFVLPVRQLIQVAESCQENVGNSVKSVKVIALRIGSQIMFTMIRFCDDLSLLETNSQNHFWKNVVCELRQPL